MDTSQCICSVFILLLTKSCLAGVLKDGNSEPVALKSDSDSSRSSKILPFLAVVSFPNTECDTKIGDLKGVCYSKKQCTAKGGTASTAPCAEGYGVCCSFTAMCPSSGGEVIIKNNLTVISGKAFPHSCKFIIPRQKGVCQIRLDFQSFKLGNVVATPVLPDPAMPMPPVYDAVAGECLQDKMSISSTSNLPNGLTLCGTAKDQHLYLDYGNMDKISLDMQAVTSGNYDIKVTMIKCNSRAKAPKGCTQYYTNTTRRIESFNYPNAQLNRQVYSVCIANDDSAQKITWRTCSQMMGEPAPQFFISGQNPGFVGQSGPVDCNSDYVLLPGTPGERYCGGNFEGPVAESNKIPFMMYVNFNDFEIPDEITMPSTIIDPTTGCPLTQVCLIDGKYDYPKPGTLCDPPGTCAISELYTKMVDLGNTGFCLEYSLG